jgi:HK97 family phage major capsid protein
MYDIRPSRWQRREAVRAAKRYGVPAAKWGRIENKVADVTDLGPIPETPEQFEEALNDEKQLKKWVDSGRFGDFVRAYATNSKSKTIMDSLAQAREQMEASMTEFLKEQAEKFGSTPIDLSGVTGGARGYSDVEARRRAKHAKRSKSAPINGVFEDFTEYVQAVWHKANNSPEMQAKIQKILDYSEKIPGEGGFLVPEEFRSEILRLALENTIVRPRARVIPMSSPRLNFPMIDETSHVSSVFGGVVVYRTEEGAELTESSAAFGMIKLDVTKQTALAHVPNELVRDWGAFDAFLSDILPEAVAYYEDLDFLTGNGVGMPLGALNAANEAMLVISGESGQAVSTVVWENILRMYSRMLPSSIGRAVWIASPDVFFELATMALSVGTGGSAVWITNAVGQPQLVLLGRPVIMTEKAPAALGTQGDLSFVDLGMYLIGDYQTMSIESSAHVKFTSDKTTYRVIQRNDGKPWLKNPLTPHNSSATLSPYVTLATR